MLIPRQQKRVAWKTLFSRSLCSTESHWGILNDGLRRRKDPEKFLISVSDSAFAKFEGERGGGVGVATQRPDRPPRAFASNVQGFKRLIVLWSFSSILVCTGYSRNHNKRDWFYGGERGDRIKSSFLHLSSHSSNVGFRVSGWVCIWILDWSSTYSKKKVKETSESTQNLPNSLRI